MSRASTKFPLRGWYVISLRPLNQHGGVRREAARFGAAAFAISTLRLQAIPAESHLRQALRCSRVLVTSPAAARFAHAQLALKQAPRQQWFAVGPGTAAALHRCGIESVLVPEREMDSEGLLALDELRDVQDARIGIITAPGGRGLLASELQARGAMLVRADVYRREPLFPSAARLRELAALPATTALLLTSAEAFSGLWKTLDDAARTQLSRRHCVVASDRLANHALALGFSPVVRAGDARPSSLLAALAADVGEPGFR